LHTDLWNGSVTFGKMDLPFVFSHVVFDPDYNPEGLGSQLVYKLNDHHALKLNLGGFVLDELAASSHDPFLLAAQLRFDSHWGSKIATSVGIAALAITRDENLDNKNVPNVNRGNTRNAAGAPAYNFNPIIADASLTYSLESFPAYIGPFPIKFGGEYMHNPAAPDRNDAFAAGVTFGKAGKKGLWELSYQYRYIGADSWYEEFPDDDFGAFYKMQQPNAGFSGVGGGYGGGTNVRGHVAKATYSPFDSLSIGLIYYVGELISPSSRGAESEASHLMVDAVWKY
jgi:hypothetical protein